MQYSDAAPFSEGLAATEMNGKWGYVDRTGKTVVEPQFDYTYGFHGGLAMVLIDDKFGYINPKGEYIWKPTK